MSTIKGEYKCIMINKFRKYLFLILLVLLLPTTVFARQPKIVPKGGEEVTIENPEISKDYYDNLEGSPRVYKIKTANPFNLYLNLLVPENTNPNGRFSARIYKGTELIREISSDQAQWNTFYKDLGGDYYIQGPVIHDNLPSGDFRIEVYNQTNQGKYLMVFGEKSALPITDIPKTLNTLPKIKSEFNSKSPATLAFTPIGIPFIITFLVIGFTSAFILKHTIDKLIKKPTKKPLTPFDLHFHILLCIVMLALGIYFWQPLLFLTSGFVLFESIFNWSYVYKFVGRSHNKNDHYSQK